MKYVCDVCGWEYDEELGCPEKGIAPGTPWAEVHDDFECPLCFVGKDQFSEASTVSPLTGCPGSSLPVQPVLKRLSVSEH